MAGSGLEKVIGAIFPDDKSQPRGKHGKFGLRANLKGVKRACLGCEKVKKSCFHREGGSVIYPEKNWLPLVQRLNAFFH